MKAAGTLLRGLLLLAPAVMAEGQPAPALEAKNPPDAPAPPKLRLPTNVRPLGHRVDLTIVPSEPAFSGRVEIDVELERPAGLIWLNATALTVQDATATTPSGPVAAHVVPGGDDVMGLAFEREIAGAVTLRLAFTGAFLLKDTRGLFRQKDGDEWYVWSQFENTEARRAFPCFDEPSLKTPWTITLHVKKGQAAFSNAPEASRTDEEGGMQAVRFKTTPPLPAYLVAVAVGPFETVDAGTAGRKKTPLRIITEKGRAAEARLAAEVTPRILELFEEYFDVSYPFEKLDQIAIPRTVGFAAMENAGLITYANAVLLAEKGQETLSRQRRFTAICAHEIAHMWFGDLVTMAWWDDVWLNESFASWLGEKVTDRYKPDWGGPVSAVTSRLDAMGSDALVTARKIRQPIETKDDIENAFDSISYEKGSAVIAMFEAWAGPDTFRKGVKRYLTKHAWGNATAADFLAAQTVDAGPLLAPAFSTFLDQPGFPIVTADLRCASGTATLTLEQRRYLPSGSSGSSGSVPQFWQTPVCVRWGDGTSSRRACTLLGSPRAEMPLPGPACPAFVVVNDGAHGYYRVSYAGDLLDRLLAGPAALSEPERVSILSDVRAAVDAGDLSIATALALVPRFARDDSRHVVSATGEMVQGLKAHLVSEALRPNYARFVRKIFGERARALGFASKPSDSEDARLLRTSLVAFEAVDGEDAALRAEAVRLAHLWLLDRRAVEPDLTSSVLRTAARASEAPLFDAFLAEARATKNSGERRQLLQALAAFPGTGFTARCLDLVVADTFDVRDAGRFLFSGDDPDRRQQTWDFLKKNWEAIVKRLPEESIPSLTFTAAGFCDAGHRADAEAFFHEKAARFPGLPRNLARTLETIDLCAARRAAQEAGVAEFLKAY